VGLTQEAHVPGGAVIHYLDNLDAKVVGVREHMQENMEDETWTQYHKLFEARFYKLPER
jgi:iron uptake system EfeUOB component EfeO/EfeM